MVAPIVPSSAIGFTAEVPLAQAADTPAGQPATASWSPSPKEHLIYHWVTMQGKTQSEVADLLEVSQATISRVLKRYERWQAHARERDGGRLDHAERLRFQRWVTFERNEVILASCLRIANEMEGFADVEKRTTSHPLNRPSREAEVRTQHNQVDRSGIAARFLRLAFHVNMQQLKLAELDAPPPADDLSADELAELAQAAATDLAALTAHERRPGKPRSCAASSDDLDANDSSFNAEPTGESFGELSRSDATTSFNAEPTGEACAAEQRNACGCVLNEGPTGEPALAPACEAKPTGEPFGELSRSDAAASFNAEPTGEACATEQRDACGCALNEGPTGEPALAPACEANQGATRPLHTVHKMHNAHASHVLAKHYPSTSYDDSAGEEKNPLGCIAAPEALAPHAAELAAVAGP
jgi:hypothetical protein